MHCQYHPRVATRCANQQLSRPQVYDRILTDPLCSRIVNLVAGAFMVLGGISHFFPIHV